MTSLRELLSDLETRGHAPSGTLERAARELAAETEKTPWYVTLLMGAGAWLATIFFLVGCASLLDFSSGGTSWAVVALVFLSLGLGARRFSSHVFVAQLSLGLTLAGWCAGVVAGSEWINNDFVAQVLVGGGLAALVYWLHPDFAARFFVSAAAWALITYWFFEDAADEALILFNVPLIVATIAAGLLLSRPALSRGLQPLGLALALTLAFTLPFYSAEFAAPPEPLPSWPSVLVLNAALAVLAWRLLKEAGPQALREFGPLCLMAVAALGGACFFGGPGLLAALFLLVLGHATGRRVLEVLGLVALPVFLFLFYHDLQVPLLAKSGIVIASGLVLLALRFFLMRRSSTREVA